MFIKTPKFGITGLPFLLVPPAEYMYHMYSANGRACTVDREAAVEVPC